MIDDFVIDLLTECSRKPLFHSFCLEGYCRRKARKYPRLANRLTSVQFKPKYCRRLKTPTKKE